MRREGELEKGFYGVYLILNTSNYFLQVLFFHWHVCGNFEIVMANCTNVIIVVCLR